MLAQRILSKSITSPGRSCFVLFLIFTLHLFYPIQNFFPRKKYACKNVSLTAKMNWTSTFECYTALMEVVEVCG